MSVTKPVFLVACQVCMLLANAQRPGLWFWGSASEESLSAIRTNGTKLRTDLYYSLGGYKLTSTAGFSGGLNDTKVQAMKSIGLKLHPIVGGGDIEVLRMLFSNPGPFIDAAVNEAVNKDLDGFNLDFEPYSGKFPSADKGTVTNEDGALYAEFMNHFANALHAKGKELSVDYFSNLGIWDLAAMNGTHVDTFMSMDTYVEQNSTEEAYVQVALGHLNAARLGMGVCPQPSATKAPYGPDPCGSKVWSDDMVAERLAYFRGLLAKQKSRFRMMAMCCTGLLSDEWWEGLDSFYKSLP